MEETYFVKALEEVAQHGIALEAELCKTQELIIEIVKNIREHPVAGFSWDSILSHTALIGMRKLENGEFLSEPMEQEAYYAAHQKGHEN